MEQQHEELRRVLQAKGGIRCGDAALLSQLSSAAAMHGLSAKDLAVKLSAHVLNHGNAKAGLSAALVDRFVAQLARDCNKENQARGGATPGGTKLTDTLGIGFKPDQQGLPSTPLAGRAAAAAAAAAGTPPGAARGGSPLTPQSAPRTAFKSRSNRGQVVSTLNSHIPAAGAGQERMVHAVPRGVQLPSRHTYLLERLEDKVAAINARISAWRQWLGAALAAAGGGGGGAAAGGSDAAGGAQLEVAPVGVPVQEEAYFVGRVVCEVEGGALNDTAVLLEGDSDTSDGARAALDLSRLPAFRLFPGQAVAVRGVNPSGGRILASALWSHLPPPGRGGVAGGGAQPMDIDAAVEALGGRSDRSGGLSAVVAAGPFCLADELGFEPLHELLTQLKAAPPNMLVLLGPFVDVEQPLIAGGMIDVTFQQLFQTQVLERLEAWQAALSAPCTVVLLPAVRDAFHHPTFPQPAIALQAQDAHLVSLQNPCSFSAGPCLMAAETTDVLRHLSGVELARNAPGVAADRLGALASHVIGQRRFYPLYPAPPGTCLDLTGDAALSLQQLPDLLLLPSDVAAFAKLVAAPQATPDGGGYVPAAAAPEGCPQVVVVNPGRLAKGSSGGTYARITVAEGSGSVDGRCRVDIVRV